MNEKNSAIEAIFSFENLSYFDVIFWGKTLTPFAQILLEFLRNNVDQRCWICRFEIRRDA